MRVYLCQPLAPPAPLKNHLLSPPQEYSVQLTFREQWTDERLKFDDIQGELKGKNIFKWI